MPYSMQNLPDVAKNKPEEQQRVCVLAANKALGRGASEEEAIFACVGAMKAVSAQTEKAVHKPIVDPRKSSAERDSSTIKKAAVPEYPSSPVSPSKTLTDAYFEGDALYLVFSDGSKIEAILPEMGEVHNYTTIQQTGGDGVTEEFVNNAIDTAIQEHLDAVDPHGQYLTQAEGDARYAALGSGGGSGIAGDSPVFIQDTQPTYVGKYLWVQTNIGGDPNAFTFFIEDGT